MPRRMFISLYLWFLVALVLTLTSAAAVFGLASGPDWEERVVQRVAAHARLGAGIVENLLDRPDGAARLERLLGPVLREDRATFAVLQADGAPVLRLSGLPDGGTPLPDAETRTEILGRGQWFEFGHGPRLRIGLSLTLPSGDPGLLYVTSARRHWNGGHLSLRAVGGLIAVLAVGLVLTWLLAAHLTHPLRRLAATADRLGRGDLAARAPVRRRDEIGRLATRFNAMAESLQRMVLAHKRLLADVSHELRSPLARLNVALELARESPAQVADYLERAAAQSADLDALIGELLDYARLDVAPEQLERSDFDLAELAGEVVARHADALEPYGIACDVQVPRGLALHADRRLLARALDNLLRNAIAHTPEGGRIAVTARREADGIALHVDDSGPGVPASALPHLFEPFYRTDPARSRDTGGSGLGLAIVERALAAHGGSARAGTAPGGRGLRITLRLPAGAGAAPG